MRTIVFALATLLLAGTAASAFAPDDELEWDVFEEVEFEREGEQYVPQFAEEIQAHDGERVTVVGFMTPLDQSNTQRHFILSANPAGHCFYCLPGGPESMIEVKAEEGIEFSRDRIIVTGTLETMTDDPMGMVYRMTDAEAEVK